MSKNECVFIPESLIKELTALGLKIEKGAPAFEIKDANGFLVPDEAIGAFVKETGIRIEKLLTDFDGIYQMVGYIPPAKACVEAVSADGKQVAAVAGENPIPSVEEFKNPGPGLKTKLNIAIAALQEVAKQLN